MYKYVAYRLADDDNVNVEVSANHLLGVTVTMYDNGGYIQANLNMVQALDLAQTIKNAVEALAE